jgi:hypothetical protein
MVFVVDALLMALHSLSQAESSHFETITLDHLFLCLAVPDLLGHSVIQIRHVKSIIYYQNNSNFYFVEWHSSHYLSNKLDILNIVPALIENIEKRDSKWSLVVKG